MALLVVQEVPALDARPQLVRFLVVQEVQALLSGAAAAVRVVPTELAALVVLALLPQLAAVAAVAMEVATQAALKRLALVVVLEVTTISMGLEPAE